MAKSGPNGAIARSIREGTRSRIVEAAVQTIKERGFAATSARAIAATGGFNQALVFYHFGSVNDLLIAALDHTSELRMARYRAAIDSVESLPELLAVASEAYREDLAGGHIKVLAEMIAGASAMPELGPEIAARMQPWITFTEEAVIRVMAGSSVGPLVPSGDLAFAIVSMYLGRRDADPPHPRPGAGPVAVPDGRQGRLPPRTGDRPDVRRAPPGPPGRCRRR